MLTFIVSLSQLILLSFALLAVVYFTLRAIIWAFGFVSNTRRVLSRQERICRSYIKTDRGQL